jgi:hypothetical protein
MDPTNEKDFAAFEELQLAINAFMVEKAAHYPRDIAIAAFSFELVNALSEGDIGDPCELLDSLKPAVMKMMEIKAKGTRQ